MASLAGFDASVVEPQSVFEPVPAGKYLALISESEMKPTKNGSGQYLQLTFVILDNGPYSGRHIWTRLNLQNSNRTAEDIAQRELSAICRAVNVMRPQDSAEMHNIPLTIIVGMERNNNTGELTNRIKGYEAAVGSNAPLKPQQTNIPAQPAPPSNHATTQQPSTQAVAPWTRNRKAA